MEKGGTAIALGMFDGVHIGHRRLLEKTLEVAKLEGLTPMAYTFSNTPAGKSGVASKSILSREESFQRIRSLGMSTIVADEFTDNMRDTEAERFLEMLITRFSMKAAVVGFNYTFGRARMGTAELLRHYGEKMGFETHVIPGVVYDGEVVSSTLIRTQIESGQIERANNLLVEPYLVSGTVMRGKRIGHTIGFPTANLSGAGHARVLPAFGVYAVNAVIEGSGIKYPAVTNVGNNPTVGGDEVTVETHILDFSDELYGKSIRVEFLKMLRPQTQFSGRVELSEQIARDVQNTRNFFKEIKR